MTLQICPNCRELGCTWYVSDENGEEQTFWRCTECEFEIEEDETREGFCNNCMFGIPSVSWFITADGGYFWCFNCSSKPTEVRPFDRQASIRALQNGRP